MGNHNWKLRAILVFAVLLFISVQIPSSYAKPTGATKQTYRSLEQITADFAAFATKYPGLATFEVIGTSASYKNIYMLKIGDSTKKGVLWQASIHGYECVTSEALYYLVEWLLLQNEPASIQILQTTYVLVIPVLCPDGYRTSANNAHGVNLNRNFETGWGKFNDANRGPKSLSEPETMIVDNFLRTNSVTWYVDLHAGSYRVTPPWASESYVPDREYYTSTYASISQIARQRGVSPIPYQEQCNYAGGTARDEGQSHGAHAWGIEISTEFFPRYSKIKASLMPKLIPVLMATT